MKKAIQMGILILSFICTSGQMPYKKNPEVAVTKEVVAVQEEKVEAPQHTEFSKLDEMLRYYFGFYKSHVLNINVIKRDHFDKEMGAQPQPRIAEKIKEFRVQNFYELSDQISEGAASFLKYRNDERLSKYIESLWKYDFQQDMNQY